MPREDFIEAIRQGSNFAGYESRLPALLDGTSRDMAREWGIGGYSRGVGEAGVWFDAKGIRIGEESMTWERAHALLLEVHGRGQDSLW